MVKANVMGPEATLQALSEDSRLLAALANPKRLEIVHILAEGKLRPTQIYEMLDLPQANSSQHLKVLRDAGIILAEQHGRERYYRLANPRLKDLVKLIRHITVGGDALPESQPLVELLPITTDPVCGMRISVPLSGFLADHAGKTYHFCASGCLKKFETNPEKYL